MIEQRLSVPAGELNLPLCVQSGQVFRWRPLDDNTWLGVAGSQLLLVRPAGTRWHLHAPETRNPIATFIHLFRLEIDLKQIQARLVRCHPLWGEWVDALPGLRLMRWLDAEECLFSFLCTPANNIPRITGMIERLCQRYGEPIAQIDHQTVHAFPKASVLANASEAELHALGFGYRARMLIESARALLARGEGWLESLRALPYEQAKRELCQLPGVGAKIADCVLLFGLDNPLAVPVDTHLWQAIRQWLIPHLRTRTLTERAYREITDWFHATFGELTGWAHQYLFTAHLLGMETKKV